jgi:hypothetical protein
MLVVHAVPQAPQFWTLLAVSTHAPVQSVGVLAGQPDMQACPPADGAQRGVPPEHFVAQSPHVFTRVRSVSHPSAATPLQSAQPEAQEEPENEHSPPVHVVAPITCGRFVQSLPHVPQWRTSLATQPPSHTRLPEEQKPASEPSFPPSLVA